MKNITAIIVDDEPLAIAELELMLKAFPQIQVIATHQRPLEAIKSIEKLQPQLVFLDINMPGMSGFELLDQLDDVPEVIFVTAYDDFAIKAFEVNALDYLLKPTNPDRLSDAIARLENKDSRFTATGHERLQKDKRIFIKDGEQCYFVPLSNIFLLESEGNYVRVYFEDKKPLLHRSLTYMESKLPEEMFFRANRQFIFNMSFIKKIDPFFNSTLLIEMQSGQKIDLSQRQSVKFREITGV